MKRFVEWAIGLAIIAGMTSASMCSSKQFYGSWGAEPTPEVLDAWGRYCQWQRRSSVANAKTEYRLVRASAPKTIFDSKLQRSLRVVKVEFVQEFDAEENLEPRREVVVMSYDAGEIVRAYYDGKGPKEYREAF